MGSSLAMPIGFLRRSGSRESIESEVRPMCFMHESLRHPMPSRTTQESYRPRVSNRTMVANLANRHACPFQERWRRHDREHETRWDVRDQTKSAKAHSGAG